MKCLIIGGNRFVGLRLSLLLEKIPGVDLHILNRTGQAPHCKTATVHKGDRRNLSFHSLDQDWDVVFDFACFTQAEAEASLRFFKRVGRYIFISTMMIYDFGKRLSEKDFISSHFDLTATPPSDPNFTYQDGKRRCEAVFATQTNIPVVSVRFPFLLGVDDYTHRLEYHTERVRRGEPIYVPNPDAELSVCDSSDAAKFLSWAADKDFYGAVNVASAETLTLRGLLAQIQTVLGLEAVFAKKEANDNHSPYGFPSDLSVNVQAVEQLGFACRPLMNWLPELIRGHAGATAKTTLH